jgi:hypothetical protein
LQNFRNWQLCATYIAVVFIQDIIISPSWITSIIS